MLITEKIFTGSFHKAFSLSIQHCSTAITKFSNALIFIFSKFLFIDKQHELYHLQDELEIAYIIYIQFVTILFMIDPDVGLTWT